MKYKESVNTIIKQGLIKNCPIDYKSIHNLIKRAFVDLKTAKRNLAEDEECAYNYAYNAILRSGLALMFSEGLRPDIKDKHLTIVKFTSSILGEEFEEVINNYDFMRRKRHHFIYEPDMPCSRKEADDAINIATELVGIIRELILKGNPQITFDFEE